MSTLASGMSMELSPTLLRNTVLTCSQSALIASFATCVLASSSLLCITALARNLNKASQLGCNSGRWAAARFLLLTVLATVGKKGKGVRRGRQHLRVALEGRQHARALRMRGATKDEGPPEALRILAQGKDVV